MGQSGKNTVFVFKRRTEQINWRKLAAIDIEKIIQELDFQTLQDTITNVTFCQIENEVDSKNLDLNFIKLFKLSQLIIEYLLHCQDYLGSVIQSLESKCHQQEEQLAQEEKAKAKMEINIQELKKENKRRRKMLQEHQQQHYAYTENTTYKCLSCPKAFVSSTYLANHLQRRHPNVAPQLANQEIQQQSSPSMAGSILEQELEEIKKRLRETEAHLADERNVVNQLRSKFKYEVREEETWKKLEEWKKEQAERNKNELESLGTLFTRELKQLQESHWQSIQQLHQQQNNNQSVAIKSPGLEAGDDVRDAIHKEREDIINLRTQLKDQIEEMDVHIQKRLEQQEKEWLNKMKHLTDKHNGELEKFQMALENSGRLLQKEREEKNRGQRRLEKMIMQINKQSSSPHYARPSTREREEKKYSRMEDDDETGVVHGKRKRVPQIGSVFEDTSVVEPFPSPIVTTSRPPSSVHSSDSSSSPRVIQVESLRKTDQQDLMPNAPEARIESKSSKEKLQAALNHNPQLLDGLRDELTGLLGDKLKRWNIKDSAGGISTSAYKHKLALLDGARTKMAQKYKNFNVLKSKLEKTLHEKLSATMTKLNPPEKRILRSVKHKPIIEVNQNKSSKQSTPVKRLTFTKPEMQILGNDGEHSRRKEESSEGVSSDTGEDEDSSDDAVRPIKTPAKVEEIQPIGSSTPVKPLRSTMPDERVSESSDWEDKSDEERARPVLQEPPIRMRPPAGKKVAELASSIERQLMRRKGEKPPAGSVDVMHVTSNKVLKFSNKSKMYGDTSSISSLEEVTPIKSIQKTANSSQPKSAHHSGSKRDRKTSWDSDLSIEELS